MALQLAYRSLSAGWILDHMGTDAARARARKLFGDEGEARVRGSLRALADAAASGAAPGPLPPLPSLLERELQSLHDCLSQAPLRTRA